MQETGINFQVIRTIKVPRFLVDVRDVRDIPENHLPPSVVETIPHPRAEEPICRFAQMG